LPAAERPVTVTVIAPPAVRDAYQAIWTQPVQGRSQSEILREIEHVADDLEVPFDEALQLFFLLQRGMPPPRAIRQTQQAAQAPPAESPAEPPVEPVPAEPAPAAQWVPPRAVDDPNYTPDPFALRRERKRERSAGRRSRRAQE
ncbi:MAG: hypothetical protein GX613_04525, partial [Chloroflexi bacterium]|nr:hypothetical protein [Chloroflexota bacterium]